MKAKMMLLCAALLFAGGSAVAQGSPPVAQRGPQAPGPDPVGENLFPPELIMSHQEAIGLAPEQKTYIRGELRKAQGQFTDLQWQLQDAMEAFSSMLKQNSVDEQAALAQLDKVLATEREIKRAQITLMVRIKNKLTPEQQARLRELRVPVRELHGKPDEN
jgi:Spy/CpxP family protein refolding chaperone